MRIISTFIPAERLPEGSPEAGANAIVMVFDTLVDDKSLIVGITEGVVEGNDLASARVSQVGQVVIARLERHRMRNYPQGAVIVAGVAQVASAKERVRQVLAKAPHQAAVLLVCANGKVYDAAFDALCLDAQSANVNLQ